MLYYYLIRKWSENGKLTGRQYVAKTIVTTRRVQDHAFDGSRNRYGVSESPLIERQPPCSHGPTTRVLWLVAFFSSSV